MPRGRPKGSGKGMQTKAVPVQYDLCGEPVQDLAKNLISKYHSHLVNANIAFLWKNKEITQKGKNIGATAEKASAKLKALSGHDFVITISYPTWQKLSDTAHLALLDHELSHCFLDDDDETGETKYSILSHDTEMFNSEVERWGLWRTELVKTAASMEIAQGKNISVEQNDKNDDIFDNDEEDL